MTYDEFILEIKVRAQERLGMLYTVALEKLLKNNGVMVDALCLNRKGEEIRPTLYLNVYYDLYQKEMLLDDIMDEILEVYVWNENHPSISPEAFRDFEKMKNRIIYKLINAERNSRRLKEVPHIYYQDLAIVFCIYIESQGENFTFLIQSEHLNSWGITEQELYELAKKNTPLLLTAEIERIERVLLEMDKSRKGNGYSEESDKLLAENGNSKLKK